MNVLKFVELDNKPKKTRLWEVYVVSLAYVGYVRYHTAWRRYCFYSACAPDIPLNEADLLVISKFLKARTLELKSKGFYQEVTSL